MKLNRGDIVIANLESVSKGSIQKYTRPYIIISNNKANQYSPVVTAVAMSTKTWRYLTVWHYVSRLYPLM